MINIVDSNAHITYKITDSKVNKNRMMFLLLKDLVKNYQLTWVNL